MKRIILALVALTLANPPSAAQYKAPFGSYSSVVGAINQARGMPADSAKELGPTSSGLSFAFSFTDVGSDDRVRKYRVEAARRAGKTYAYGFLTSHVLGYTDLYAMASVALLQSRLAQDCLAMSKADAKAYNLWAIEKMAAAADTGGGRYERIFGKIGTAVGVIKTDQGLEVYANAGRGDAVPTSVWPTYCRVK